MEEEVEDNWDIMFVAISVYIHGITAFALSYALHCHLKFRKADEKALLFGGSTAPFYETRQPNKFKEVLKKIKPALDRYVVLYSLILFVYLIISTVFLVLVNCLFELYIVFGFNFECSMQDSENNVVEIMFVVIYFLHQFPSLVLIVLILFHRNPFKSTLFTLVELV